MAKGKRLKILGGVAFVCFSAGVAIGGLFLDDVCGGEQNSDFRTQSVKKSTGLELKLKSELAELKTRFANQSEQLQIALAEIQELRQQTSQPATLKNAELPSDQFGAELKKAQARIEELEGQLAAIENTELQARQDLERRVPQLLADYWAAIEEKDAPAAISILKELAGLGEVGFRELPELWLNLKKNDWYGVRWRHRYIWLNGGFLRWVLNPDSNLNISGPPAEELKLLALKRIRSYESDLSVLAKLYATTISNKSRPEIIKDNLSARERRNAERNDAFRVALGELKSITSVKASEALSTIFLNQSFDRDIRKTALDGLVNQKDSGSLRTLRQAAKESDPILRQKANLGLARRDPPVDGWLITRVTQGSQAEKLGIEVGAIITMFNNNPVRSTKDLRRHRDAAPGAATMTVYMQGQSRVFQMQGRTTIGVNGESVLRKR